MAVTITVAHQGVDSLGKRYVEADVAFSNPYVAAGEVVNLSDIGLSRVERVEIVYTALPEKAATVASVITHGRQIFPDVTNVYAPKLKLYVSNNTESGAVDQTQVKSRIRFVGV